MRNKKGSQPARFRTLQCLQRLKPMTPMHASGHEIYSELHTLKELGIRSSFDYIFGNFLQNCYQFTKTR